MYCPLLITSTLLMVVSRVVAKVAIIYHRSGVQKLHPGAVCIHQEGYKNMLEMIILSQSNCNQSEKGK